MKGGESMYEKLIAYLPSLNGEKHGKWVSGKSKDPSASPFGFLMYDRTGDGIMHEVYRIVDRYPQMGLNRYQEILEKNGIHWNKQEMKEADVSKWDDQGVMALLVGILRADRFVEGVYKEFLENGCIRRWIERLKEIDAEK